MEREQGKFFGSHAAPETNPPQRESPWSSENPLKRSNESSSCPENKIRTKARKSSSDESSSSEPNKGGSSKKNNKTHVPSACANCKKAHLACDVSRPCKRCLAMGKTDTCVDIQHKKRGRPKIKDKKSESYLHDSKYSQIIHLTPTTFDAQSEVRNCMFQSNPAAPSDKQPVIYRHGSSQRGDMYGPPPNQPSLQTHASSPKPGMNVSNHSRFQTLSSSDKSVPKQYNIYEPAKQMEDKHSLDSSTTRSSEEGDFIMMLDFKMDCAMISEEYHELLGYTSQDLVNQSFYSIVHTTDTERVKNLREQIIDHVVNGINQFQGGFLSAPLKEGFGCSLSTGDIQKQSYEQLKCPASMSEDFTEAIHIRRKDGGYELFNVHMRIGGAFGTHVMKIDSYDKAYIICRLAKFQLPSLQLNSNSSSSSGGNSYSIGSSSGELPYLTQ
ncbi:hypothetical protein K493DRAFT_341354 [Basidiobolus meristosporus CBS 931.73]|uniref:Zn(2)-C6 fungal-type domain-containing protein n=1 Tax=Basidiobolus meristosporus CBS 931.73 TaxID=1314790 RepID=A0A1Y1XRK0_9FUNG|nr:hypothetical protein K493DRAFT_341354 [Basidiobolus meristosporus CBS 931.73]|eukprot:ORX88353.1 hypothetical protein K493DRAFT_341354 [Basidiobolus meristosporus CBS 931.73]